METPRRSRLTTSSPSRPSRLPSVVSSLFKNPHDDIGLRYFSLRFDDGGVERGFGKSLRESLRTNACYTGVLGFTMYVLWLATFCYDPSCYGSDMSYEIKTRARIADGVNAFLCLVLAAVMKAEANHEFLGDRGSEIFLTVLTFLILIFGTLSEDFVMGQVLGYETSSLPYKCNEQLSLAMCILILVTHTVLPLRWSSMWWMDILLLLWQPAVMTALRGGSISVSTSIAFCPIIVSAVVGKRTMEITQRRLFQSVITERALRAQSEFKLSQTERSGRHGRKQPLADSLSQDSRGTAMTGATGYLFDEETVPSNIVRRLDQLRLIGRQEHWLVESEQLRVAHQWSLGSGSHGAVFAGTLRGLKVAVKMSRRRLGADSIHRAPLMINELRVLRQVRHPNITNFFGAVIDSPLCELALVLELVHGPGLDAYVKKWEGKLLDRSVVERNRFDIAFGSVRALDYLHCLEPAIVHGDLKPSNVMVELTGNRAKAKLVDFGLARVVARGVRGMGGTLVWMAPELFHEDDPNPIPSTTADIFSFGRILLFLVSGLEPYEGREDNEIRACMEACDVQIQRLPAEIPATSQEIYNIAVPCVEVEPEDRPTSEKISAKFRMLEWDPKFKPELHGPDWAVFGPPEEEGESSSGNLSELFGGSSVTGFAPGRRVPDDAMKSWFEGVRMFRRETTPHVTAGSSRGQHRGRSSSRVSMNHTGGGSSSRSGLPSLDEAEEEPVEFGQTVEDLWNTFDLASGKLGYLSSAGRSKRLVEEL